MLLLGAVRSYEHGEGVEYCSLGRRSCRHQDGKELGAQALQCHRRWFERVRRKQRTWGLFVL